MSTTQEAPATTAQDAPVAAAPAPQQVVYVQEVKKGNPVGTSALVLGIIAFAFAWMPFFGVFISFPLAGIGLILGVVGLLLKGRPKVTSIIGASVSAAGILVSILNIAVIYAAGS